MTIGGSFDEEDLASMGEILPVVVRLRPAVLARMSSSAGETNG